MKGDACVLQAGTGLLLGAWGMAAPEAGETPELMRDLLHACPGHDPCSGGGGTSRYIMWMLRGVLRLTLCLPSPHTLKPSTHTKAELMSTVAHAILLTSRSETPCSKRSIWAVFGYSWVRRENLSTRHNICIMNMTHARTESMHHDGLGSDHRQRW